MAFQSLEEILTLGREQKLPFWKVVLQDDVNERGVSEEESRAEMRKMWKSMLFASDDYQESRRSNSGLAGGDGGKMQKYLDIEEPLCGEFVGQVLKEALCMGESNACMRRIVAAPTAGACGVLPAVLVPYYKKKQITEEDVLKALYVAAGVGQVIAARAYIAGASGGCQAEIGAASAMAAAAMVAIRKGSNEQMTQASAMALKNLLGLVCDPVAGLVEVPCVKRNVIGAMGALAAADMALAGITSRIPPDQVIDAMKEVGDLMNVSLKETGEGGLAATPAGRSVVLP